LGSESGTCVGSRVHLVGVLISFEKNFYRLPFTPPLSSSPYRSSKFDKDESLDGVILPVKIIGKEDIGLFFFPQNPETTSTLVHQLMHLSCITRLLLVVGPPGFTKRG
jgi:hypothetical protein